MSAGEDEVSEVLRQSELQYSVGGDRKCPSLKTRWRLCGQGLMLLLFPHNSRSGEFGNNNNNNNFEKFRGPRGSKYAFLVISLISFRFTSEFGFSFHIKTVSFTG